MATLKTIPTDKDVITFLKEVEPPVKREDCLYLLKMMEHLMGEKPKMWGPSIIGFGQYHYKYESGREGDFLLTGFSPRKQHIVVYCMTGYEKYPDLMQQLGKYKTGKSCLYIKKLADIDLEVLSKVIKISAEDTLKRYSKASSGK